jgi:hypothetical protein
MMDQTALGRSPLPPGVGAQARASSGQPSPAGLHICAAVAIRDSGACRVSGGMLGPPDAPEPTDQGPGARAVNAAEVTSASGIGPRQEDRIKSPANLWTPPPEWKWQDEPPPTDNTSSGTRVTCIYCHFWLRPAPNQRAAPGIEPGTSRTRSENHTTRPSSQ